MIVIDDGADAPIPDDPRVRAYEDLLAAATPFDGRFEVADENRAAAMCYTSGTTGNPKGVVYSHRSAVLHSLIALTADGFGLTERDVVMPVVPMFHANAWGLPYGCVMAGSDLVLPGPRMTPADIVGLLARHRVTVTGGVPTIWMGVLPLLADHDLSALRVIICGGSAVPRALSERYRKAIGIPMLHAWGMTETSPVATICRLQSVHEDLSDDGQADVRARQGQAVPLVDLRVVDPHTGEPQPWDDVASGEIQLAGPWIAKEYYRGEGGGAQFTSDGWLRTGDVAAVDRHGYVRLVDRTKDLIKSGGEWIGSVELENEIMAHPKVAEAAVIAIPHETVAGAAAGLRGGQTRRGADRSGGAGVPDPAGGQVVAAGRGGVHRRGAQDQRRQVLQEDAAGEVRRVPRPRPGRLTLLSIAELAERVRAGPARCGDTRLVCVDGPSGAGKSTLADRLAAALGEPAVLRMDDLYPGWNGLSAAVPLLFDQVVGPLAAGQPAGYRRYDWHRGKFAETRRLGRPELLVVEGVAAGARPVAPYTSLLVWVDAPAAERFRRGIERDGETYRPHWARWAEQEAAHFAADGTRDRADLRVDGAPGLAHDPATQLVLLP